MFLIDSIGLSPQSAVTLYIYRVGKTYLARNPIYRSKSIKNSNYCRIPPRSVRPVGPTGRSPAGLATVPRPVRLLGQTTRSDRSDRLVPILAVNICPSVF